MNANAKYRLVESGGKCHLQELQETFFGKEYVTLVSFHRLAGKRLTEAVRLLNECVGITALHGNK